MVPGAGLEPARFYSMVFETIASTNSAIWAGNAFEVGLPRAASRFGLFIDQSIQQTPVALSDFAVSTQLLLFIRTKI